MKSGSERSLKSLNMKWLVSLVGCDLVLVVLFVVPELVSAASVTQLGIARGLAVVVLPVVVLLIGNVLPANTKAMLVYWRPLGVLPGAESFTKYGPSDPRIDMVALKKNVGVLPTDAREQNSKWYKLYKMVENQTEVSSAQKDFLMYRDMAVMSLPLMVLVPLGLYFMGVHANGLWICAGLFLVQYILTAISARHAGIRFVCNVLAIHAAKKVTMTKPPA
jgi:hypothetical protein